MYLVQWGTNWLLTEGFLLVRWKPVSTCRSVILTIPYMPGSWHVMFQSGLRQSLPPRMYDGKIAFRQIWSICSQALYNKKLYYGFLRGTPKSSILMGFSIIHHPFGGTIYGNPPINARSDLSRCSPKLPGSRTSWVAVADDRKNKRWNIYGNSAQKNLGILSSK